MLPKKHLHTADPTPDQIQQWAEDYARWQITELLTTFPALRSEFAAGTDAEAAAARRFIARAVREAERSGHPLRAQSILWGQLVELANAGRRAQTAYRRAMQTDQQPELKPELKRVHWTQTPQGKRKLSRRLRRFWREGR